MKTETRRRPEPLKESPVSPPGAGAVDEMGYGLVVVWMAFMVFAAGYAVMYHGHGRTGMGITVLGVLMLLRGARHVRRAYESEESEQ